jgi:hypothetical protein
MTQDEIEEMAELSGLYLYKTNEELIYCLTYFAKLVAEKSKQEQGEPIVKKEWVGLTDDDMEFLFPFGKSAWLTETLKIFEAKLKERNT